jgi:hypothetical protein
MSLPTNPQAALVSSLSQSISQAMSQSSAAMSSAASDISKINLDTTMSRLSGEIGSGLNGVTAGIGNAIDMGQKSLQGLTSQAGSIGLNGVTGALGGIANQATSLVSSIGGVAGSISNITADVAASVNKLTGGNLAGGLLSVASSISSAAGMVNNLLSMRRGANLPANGQLFQSRGTVVSMTPTPSNDWRVRLDCNWELFNSDLFNSTLKKSGGMVWPYLPTITVSTKAQYTQLDPVHNNFPFQAYKNSQVDDITISGEFSCENEQDAYYWIAATTFLRTATKMFYGTGPNVGNPPIVCQLNGYGSNIFNTVPVVVKAASFDLKDDIQYIKCQMGSMTTPSWVPIMSTISITVTPIYNRSRLRQFSLEDFASGKTASTVGFL